MEILNVSEQIINVNAAEEIIEVNVIEEIIEINVTEEVVNIIAQTGAYPLPATVFSVFGRIGHIVGQAGDYTTSLVTEGSNLYYTQARFDTSFGNKTTTDLAEGNNLYYTQARFNTAFGNKTTTDLAEGNNLYFTNARSRESISVDINGIDYSIATGVFSLENGYLIPTQAMFDAKQAYLDGTGIVKSTAGTISYVTDNSGNWNAAYNDKINSASVTGTTTKVLTLNQQDGGTITASWTDDNTDAVTSVFGRTGAVIAENGDYTTNQVTEGSNLYYTDARSRSAISETITGINYDNLNGIFSLVNGYLIPTQAMLDAKVPYTGATGNVTLGEHQLAAGQIAFDQTPTGTAGVGIMRWNNTDGTLDLGLKGGNVNLQIGQEIVARVVNKTGADLLEANYKVVRISSAQGQRVAVQLAQANNDANSTDTIGIVTETIENNQEGFITILGQVKEINTTGSLQGESWADGDVLYLSPTIAGGITNIKPTAPQHMVAVGYVEYAHSQHGKIYVKIQNGYELEELHDVAATPYVNKGVLYRDTTTNLWKSATIDTLLGYTPAASTRTISTTAPLTGGGDLSANRTFAITQSSVSADGYLSSADWSTFNNKENFIVSGTTAQYYRGDKTFQTLDTLAVPENTNLYYTQTRFNTAFGNKTTSDLAEGTNLYYTDARARAAITGTLPISVINGVVSISEAGGASNGYLSSTDWNTFNNKQAALSGTGFVKSTDGVISYDTNTYLTTISGIAAGGELSGTYANPTLVNSAVTGKILSGVNITGGSISDTDSILTAFGKLQNQVNGLVGGSIYKGTWNAATNTPNLTSGVGTKGWYYIVDVYGTTNLDGVSEWHVGDWAIFDGVKWQKVDTTDAVTSVNGEVGAVSLTTSNIAEGTNLYFTNARAISSTLTGYTSGAGTITSSDTILSAIQKLNGNMSNLVGSVSSVFGRTGDVIAQNGDYTTTQVTEGTNLYYTQSRFDTAFSGKSTTNLTEGTNLYYTQARFNTAFGNKTTSDLSEGTNLYYTEARVNANANVAANTAARHNAVTIGTANGLSLSTQVLSLAAANTSTTGALTSTDWNTFNGKQGVITLTTTGSSGASTFTSNTLNIPNYTLSGLGGVPTSRTLTINGTALDLSSNRSWTISTGTTLDGTGFVKANGTTITYDNSSYYLASNPSGYITSSASITGSAASLALTSATITSNAWAGGGGYHGYSYSGGNWRFGFSSSSGVVSVYADGEFYATDNAYLVIHAGNYNSYAPTLTGGNASGTWGISITGNATTSTSSTYLNSSNYIQRCGSSGNATTDFQNTPAGTKRFQGDDANLSNSPGGAWWFYENYRHSNSNNYWGTQVAWGWEDNANRLATRNVTANSFGSWVYYLNSNNYNQYAPTLTGGNASGTWGISITGNSSSVGGYSVSVAGTANTIPTRNGSGYLIPENWIQLNGHYGLYSPTNGAHFYPNNATYGAWKIEGTRNGWNGIHFGGGNGMTLMMNETEFGFHREGYGWYARFTAGRFYGTSDNTASISSAVGGAYTWSGIQQFETNNGGQAVNNSSSARLQAYSSGNNSAYMSFHKGGHYAINMGLDDDNVFRIGGWSAAANRLQMDMSGNLTMAGTLTGTEVYSSGWLRTSGSGGLYFGAYARGLADPQSQYQNYGNVCTYGTGHNGWWGYAINDGSYNVNFMSNSGGYGLYGTRNGWGFWYDYGQSAVAIGGGSAVAGYSLSVPYDIYCRSVTQYSDERAKKDIEQVTNALSKVKRMRGVSYDFIDNGEDNNKYTGLHLGVIAQEIQEIEPILVNYDKNEDKYSVEYQGFDAIFIEAIKEFHNEYSNTIIDLQTQINDLKKQLNK